MFDRLGDAAGIDDPDARVRVATEWRNHLIDTDVGGPTPLQVPLQTALLPLTQAVCRCAVAHDVPSDFHTTTRRALGAYLAAFQKAERGETAVSEGLAVLGDLIAERIQVVNADPIVAARRLAVALDAVQLLIRLSERTMRSWENRRNAEAANSTATFAEVLGIELAGRLGAAIAALDLLDSQTLSPDERDQLEVALTKSIQAARACADDLMHISPSPQDTDTPALPLDELTFATVGRLRDWAAARDVELSLTRPPPSIRVDASPFQALLFNLVTVAVHRAEEVSGPVRIDMAFQLTDDGAHTELALSSDAPLFSTDWDRDPAAPDLGVGPGEMEDLSLWLTAESADRLGGRLELVDGAEHARSLRILFPVGAQPS